jgi:hypothetical protein
MSLNSNAKKHLAKVIKALSLFAAHSPVLELRALNVDGTRKTFAGHYDTDNLGQMAAEALALESISTGVYLALNPRRSDLLRTHRNEAGPAKQDELAKDQDVLRRCWLFVDADPVRPSGVSATDAEKNRAAETIAAVFGFLTQEGWPAPAVADSGNGFHLLYRIDLPADDGGLVQRVLQALAARFDTETVKIDTSVHNPARFTKL